MFLALLCGELSNEFLMFRAKDVNVYRINQLVEGITVSSEVGGLCSELRMVSEKCQTFVESSGYAEFYKCVLAASIVVTLESEGLPKDLKMPPSIRMMFRRMLSNKRAKLIPRIASLYPKATALLLSSEGVAFDLESVIAKFNHQTHDKQLFGEIGLTFKLFTYFCDLVYNVYKQISVSPISHGYGPGQQFYVLRITDVACETLPGRSGTIISAKSLTEAKIRFCLYLITESVSSTLFSGSWNYKDSYHQKLVERINFLKEAKKNAKK